MQYCFNVIKNNRSIKHAKVVAIINNVCIIKLMNEINFKKRWSTSFYLQELRGSRLEYVFSVLFMGDSTMGQSARVKVMCGTIKVPPCWKAFSTKHAWRHLHWQWWRFSCDRQILERGFNNTHTNQVYPRPRNWLTGRKKLHPKLSPIPNRCRRQLGP
jgi:hypothetical protein